MVAAFGREHALAVSSVVFLPAMPCASDLFEFMKKSRGKYVRDTVVKSLIGLEGAGDV